MTNGRKDTAQEDERAPAGIPRRVEETSSGGARSSGEVQRSSNSWATRRASDREHREAPPEARNHLSGRRDEGVSGERGKAVVEPDEDLLRSFETGDPEVAYAAAVNLVVAYRELQRELAKVRFQTNFGSKLCENCEGLKAGPGVIATCYQVRMCNFTNFKESDHSSRHLRVLDSLAPPTVKIP